MSDITCTQCGNIIVPDNQPAAMAGSTILCPHCDTPVSVLRRTRPPSQNQSQSLQTYLTYCHETCNTRNIPFNTARIRRFEAYLSEHDLTLQSVETSHIKAFLQWIETTQNVECSQGYASNLLEFFYALTQKGFLTVNPLEKQRLEAKPVAKIDTKEFSAELTAFIDHQQSIAFFDGLKFDIRRIQTWEAFLTQRDKHILTAEADDFTEFMADIDTRMTPKQASGLALTIHDLYTILIQLGMLEKSPEPNDFIERQKWMDLIIHSEEISQTSDAHLQQLRHKVQTTRNWRLIFLIIAGIFFGFGGLLAYQLLFKNKQEIKILQKTSLTSIIKKATQTIPVPTTTTTSSTTTTTTTSSTTTIPEKTVPEKAILEKPATKMVAPQKATTEKPIDNNESQQTKATSPQNAKVTPPAKDCIDGDCQNGIGTFLFSDGAKYIGSWKNGKMDGDGQFKFPSGRGYRGKWQKGRLSTLY